MKHLLGVVSQSPCNITGIQEVYFSTLRQSYGIFSRKSRGTHRNLWFSIFV